MGYCPLSIRQACRRAGRVGAQAGRAGRCDTARHARSRALGHGAGYCHGSYSTCCIAGSQGGPSNLHRFRAHHPSTFTEGGGPMVADHWFIQIKKVLEAMEITSDTTRIRLAAFQLESEAQVEWKWARTS